MIKLTIRDSVREWTFSLEDRGNSFGIKHIANDDNRLFDDIDAPQQREAILALFTFLRGFYLYNINTKEYLNDILEITEREDEIISIYKTEYENSDILRSERHHYNEFTDQVLRLEPIDYTQLKGPFEHNYRERVEVILDDLSTNEMVAK